MQLNDTFRDPSGQKYSNTPFIEWAIIGHNCIFISYGEIIMNACGNIYDTHT